MADSRFEFANADPWVYAFGRTMREKLEQLESQLVLGGATDYAAYRELVGEIRGIQNCMAELISIFSRLSNPDQDRDISDHDARDVRSRN